MKTPTCSRFAVLWAAAILAALPGLTPSAALADNLPPTVQFTTAPPADSEAYYAQRFSWLGNDPDGVVASYRYAIDPSPPDTFWIGTTDTTRFLVFQARNPVTPYPSPGQPLFCTEPHTVVVEAIDDLGLASAPESRTFIARTEAPSVQILSPTPSPTANVPIPTTVTIDWAGIDADGLFTPRPVYYKYHVATRATIQATLGITQVPNAFHIQQYFSLAAPGFASWDTRSQDSSDVTFTNLNMFEIYYFGVTAFDEALAWEPRFSRPINVISMVVMSVVGDASRPGDTAELRLAGARPNPAHADVVFDLTMPRDAVASLDVFDLSGRRVRRIVSERMTAGMHSVAWDLRDESAHLVHPGAYLARFTMDGATRVRRFVVMH